MSQVILISGKQGAGKTTLANYLVSILPKATRISFADPMRALVKGMLATAKDIDLELPEQAETRVLMQVIGTEWGRESIDDLIWVKYALKKTQSSEFSTFIFDDNRFKNEFDAFPNAIRLRLECSSDLREKRAKYWGNPDHRSEVELDDYHKKFDAVFDTSRDVDQTMHSVRNWLEYKTKLI